MNKIGEIEFKSEIKIVDAFDFPEQFSIQNLSNIQEGTWLAFNEIEINEEYGDRVIQFLIVEKKYFQQNGQISNWETGEISETGVSIEKGVVGIFNKSFIDWDTYINEMDEVVSNSLRAGVTDSYVVCKTNGDGDYWIDKITNNDKVVAIRICFDQ